MRIQKTAGVAPPKNTKNATCSTTAAVRRLVVERGHLGVTNTLVQHEARCDTNRAAAVLSAMTRKGEIHVGNVKGHRKHWFASAELAMRWQTTTKPVVDTEPRYRQRMVKMDRIKEPTTAQNIAMVRHQLPGVTIRPRPDTTDNPVHLPDGVLVQRGPSYSHDSRYQCTPGERPAGAGFAAAGVGRDVITGGAWGPRA